MLGELTETLTGVLGQVPPAAVYGIVAAALLVESNLLFGVLVPTLTLMLTAGALAGRGHLRLPILVAVAAGAVIAADLISYHTGRILGGRLRTSRLGRRIPAAAWARAEQAMARHGARGVAPARFIPLLRTLVPHLAGATHVPYRRVAPYSITAAVTWTLLAAGTGYTAARSVDWLSAAAGPLLAIAALAAAVAVIVVVRRRRSTRKTRTVTREPHPSGGPELCPEPVARDAVPPAGFESR
ncbi:DedA family protein [Dactylosporangium sp. CA-233914]|uniref:DedA family protein n=1 Tax=Dactylosporangium sp. CA-233914 TaxID=3239934 RepID=UPI003D8C3843